jgi:hypothetical protein
MENVASDREFFSYGSGYSEVSADEPERSEELTQSADEGRGETLGTE